MPSIATNPAPVSAPVIRAESWVVRWMLIAPISCEGGMVSPTSAVRMPMSEGRTRPSMAAITSTITGVTASMNASVISNVASTAYSPRIAHNTLR
jgi:hypothetical protein